VGSFKRIYLIGDLNVDGRIILKCISEIKNEEF
jgi:hypothetical protein